MQVPGYEFLPHTTDAYVQAVGSTFEQALEYAGLALFDIMCNLKSISHQRVEQVEVNGIDEASLTYNWLESLLLKFEIEHKVFSKFEVNLTKAFGNSFQMKAELHGEAYDKGKHGSKVEVKAVTYHRMEIIHDAAITTIRFILDL